MIISAKTDIGKSRDENQDSFTFGYFNDGAYAVVCDGMGGVYGGKKASEIAVNTFADSFTKMFKADMSEKSVRNILKIVCEKTNSAVYEYSCNNPEYSGMGTTIVACVIINDVLYVLHAGDSRAYSLKDGALTALTKDHSMVQQLVDEGYITEEQAEHHMYKNLITRAVGTEDAVKIDCTEYSLEKDETLLLCTDGLTNYISINNIIAILSENEPDDAVQRLVDSANAGGGGDNITVVVIKNN